MGLGFGMIHLSSFSTVSDDLCVGPWRVQRFRLVWVEAGVRFTTRFLEAQGDLVGVLVTFETSIMRPLIHLFFPYSPWLAAH